MRRYKIIAVTVNWNRAEDTLACVRSLKAQSYPLDQIIVVDNGSDEEPSFMSLNPFKDVEVLQTMKNLGFGAGVNRGIQKALDMEAEYVLLINNDTIADEEMVEQLISESLKVGFEISAPLIYYYAQPKDVWSSGGIIYRLIAMPLNAHNRKTPPQKNTRRSFLTGCCLLMSRTAFGKVGVFAEDFFMYYEDLEYMARATQLGVKMGVVPLAKLWHKEAQSSGGYLNPKERYWSARSLMKYSKRATTWWNAVPLWLHRMISSVLWTFRLLFRGKPEALRAYWQGIRDGLKA